MRKFLSSSLPVVQLGTLVKAEPDYGLSSRAVPRRSNDEPRFIRITDFGEDGIEASYEFATADPIDLSYKLSANDILFARSGATTGKTYLHEDTSELAIFAGYCIRFRFDESRVFPKFVYWWTKTAAYSRWTDAIQRPSGQPNINKEEFKSCPIPLPSTSEQGKLLAAMDAARAERKAKLAEADALLAGVDDFVLDALGLARPPEDSRRVYAVMPAQMQAQVRLNPEYYNPERTAVLRVLNAAPAGLASLRLANVVTFVREQVPSPTENYLSLSHVQSHTGELTDSTDTASGACFEYQPSDVLFARLRPYLNKVHRAETWGSCSTEFHVLRIFNTGALLPDYLAAILRSKIVLAQTVHMMTGNTHPRLTNDDVANLTIPVPSMEVQQTIAAEINSRRREARRLRAEAETGWQAARLWFEDQLLGGSRYDN